MDNPAPSQRSNPDNPEGDPGISGKIPYNAHLTGLTQFRSDRF